MGAGGSKGNQFGALAGVVGGASLANDDDADMAGVTGLVFDLARDVLGHKPGLSAIDCAPEANPIADLASPVSA